MTLFPGNADNSAEKTFSWDLESLNGNKAVLRITLDNPNIFSLTEEEPDRIGITYKNNGIALTPIDENKITLPDDGGFLQTIKIQPKNGSLTTLSTEFLIETTSCICNNVSSNWTATTTKALVNNVELPLPVFIKMPTPDLLATIS